MNDHSDPPLSPDIRFQLIKKIECHKVIGLGGYELREHEAKYLEFHRLAGVILFDRNIRSVSQVGELVESVEERLSGDGLPPLVMADHEGDFVSELRRLIGVPPAALAIAATGDPQLAHDVARETGTAMAKLGVNVVLAPVADCYLTPASPVTGLRTFGRDPERVAEFVSQTIKGFQGAGVLACVKHFPGHGSTGDDSHEELPEVQKSLDGLRELDLVPFARAIRDGVDLVMTAHVAYRLGDGHDDHTPASFDTRLMRTLLRDELGFEGVVITDALEMEGARIHARERYGGLSGGFERSILAGSDLLLYASPVPEHMAMQDDSEPMIAVEVMQTIIETLHKVVDRSRIDRKLEEAAKMHEGIRNLLEILDVSEARIQRLRDRAREYGSEPAPKPVGNVIHLHDYASTPAIYKTVAERSLVLVRDPDSFLPVAPDEEWVLLPILHQPGESLKSQDLESFCMGLLRSFPLWTTGPLVVGFDTDTGGRVQPVFARRERELVLDAQRATGSDLAGQRLDDDAALLPVFSTRGMPPEGYLVALSDFATQRDIPFALVTGSPIYDWVPDTAGCLLTLGASPQVAAALASVLAGQATATGSLAGLV